MKGKKLEKMVKTVAASTACLSMGITLVLPVQAQDTAVQAIQFDNTGEGEDAISLTEPRSFTASIELDMSKEDVQKLVDEGQIQWALTRAEGMQDTTYFPYQYLGENLESWKTVKSAIQDEQPMFTDIQNTVSEGQNGKTLLTLTFNSKALFGYNGIDNRDRQLVRDTILDYTGEYELTCKAQDEVLGTASVDVRPYDSFHTQSEIDKELFALAERANKAGIYAKVEEIGQSADGRPIRAIFIAKDEKTLEESKKLSERAETEPEKVAKEVNAGTLDYKVPVMYSNVHADEIIGSDGCMEFLEAIVSAAENGGKLTYNKITGMTKTGQETLEKEMQEDGTVWSDLIKDKGVTGVGYIQGEGKYETTDPSTDVENNTNGNADAAVDMTEEEMSQYYNIEETEFDLNEVLSNEFFIVVPSENVDGKTYNTRTNGNSFDLNRDNTFQTQPETQAMTALIAKWNPVSFHEIHGYYTQFQVEPCSPTHEPNVEYDLFIENAIKQGENFGASAIANNDSINSFQMPMRDYLKVSDSTSTGKNWDYPFDDMSTSYTPQYSFLHGVNAYTVELPYGSADAAKAIKYGFIGNADYIAEEKDSFFLNQLEVYERGIKNIDEEGIRQYYVSQADEPGAEADVFRKKYEENDNFFPEYYVIPMDADSQQDTQSASDMVEYLLRNDVRLKELKEDTTVNGKEYKKGTIIVDMHQAKRNMANAALYSNIVIADWTDLYSEPLTAFSQLRGFDMDVITTVGAFADAAMDRVESAEKLETAVSGEGKAAILSNNSVHAVQAVNDLLKEGRNVGYITQGEEKGNFVISADDFELVKDNYILKARLTDDVPVAKEISKSVKVYIPGKVAEFKTDSDGNPYGVKDYNNLLNYEYGWDLFAFGEQLGFELVDNAKDADVIVGNETPSSDEMALIQNGKPYIGYTAEALYAAKAMGVDIGYVSNGMYDALTTVTYPEESLITDKYVQEGDYIMYGHDGAYITNVPEGAKVLIQTTDDYPIEGFMSSEHIEKYKNSVQAIDYVQNGFNMTLFANTMTNKAHQQDDYRYVTNAIYTKMLGEDFEIGEEKSLSTAVLEYAVELAGKASTDGVVASVVEKFDAALANAKDLLGKVSAGDETVTQSMIDKSWQDLITVMQYLNFKQGDKTDLQKVVEMARSIELNKYYEEGHDAFNTALASAINTLADGDAMQDEVDASWKALLKAMSELRLKPDKSALETLIAKAEELEAKAYSAVSYAAMEEALASAKAVFADDAASQEDVDNAKVALGDAIAKLESAEKTEGIKEEQTDLAASGSNTDQTKTDMKADAKIISDEKKAVPSKKAAKTGDNADIAVPFAGMLTAAAAAILFKKKK